MNLVLFKGPALRLADTDIVTIAGYLGCHIAAVRALIAVESAGRGFGNDGRPLILNEPHVLWRELSGEQRTRAVNEGLAYQQWGTRPYLETQAQRYDWLIKAMNINQTAALRSCSWSLGQVMGFNHLACGFKTVQEYVAAQLLSEGAHLYCMARFIVHNGIQGHLRTRSWASFARVYNGPGYEKNNYHNKIAAAYDARPAHEKITPPPTSEDVLFALIAAKAIKEPPPVEPTPTEPEPTADELRKTQPYQTKLEEVNPIVLLIATVILAVVAGIIMWFSDAPG